MFFHDQHIRRTVPAHGEAVQPFSNLLDFESTKERYSIIRPVG